MAEIDTEKLQKRRRIAIIGMIILLIIELFSGGILLYKVANDKPDWLWPFVIIIICLLGMALFLFRMSLINKQIERK